jgi:hypothetical protein
VNLARNCNELQQLIQLLVQVLHPTPALKADPSPLVESVRSAALQAAPPGTLVLATNYAVISGCIQLLLWLHTADVPTAVAAGCNPSCGTANDPNFSLGITIEHAVRNLLAHYGHGKWAGNGSVHVSLMCLHIGQCTAHGWQPSPLATAEDQALQQPSGQPHFPSQSSGGQGISAGHPLLGAGFWMEGGVVCLEDGQAELRVRVAGGAAKGQQVRAVLVEGASGGVVLDAEVEVEVEAEGGGGGQDAGSWGAADSPTGFIIK